jgi:hypothetical protein
MIDIQPAINKVLNLNETRPFNQNFNAIGLESKYFLNNMNTLLLGFYTYFALVLINIVVDRLQVKYKRLSNLAERLRHMLFYNLIITLLTESYMMIAVSCMIGLTKLTANNFGDFIQSASTIFALLVLIAYPIFVYWITRKIWIT